MWKYIKTNLKTWYGKRVFAAYMFDEFDGYRIHRNEKERNSFRKKFYNDCAAVLVREWVAIPDSDLA